MLSSLCFKKAAATVLFGAMLVLSTAALDLGAPASVTHVVADPGWNGATQAPGN